MAEEDISHQHLRLHLLIEDDSLAEKVPAASGEAVISPQSQLPEPDLLFSWKETDRSR